MTEAVTCPNDDSGSWFTGTLFRLGTALVLGFLLSACSTRLIVEQGENATLPAPTAFDAAGKAWWKVFFRIDRDAAKDPDWHVDALLADQVLAPIVSHTEPRILLWRFHRRAADDAAGHRFSFLFYADRDTAQTVNRGVETSDVVQQLRGDGVLIELNFAAIDESPDPALQATSDPGWPEEIQRSWPWYIMGISQSWLKLISEVRTSRPLPESASVKELLEYYRGVHEKVSRLWREHGQHAYLHHLNALFGYQPLVIRETNLKRF